MAVLTAKPDFSSTLPTSGYGMVNRMTTGIIWGEMSLQYGFGSQDALTLNPAFEEDFRSIFSGLVDADFVFSSLANRAFGQIDAICNLDFSLSTDIAGIDLFLVSSDDNPSREIEGFFEFPSESSPHDGAPDDRWSFGAFNSGLTRMRLKAEAGGGQYANWTLLHEIGHGLGLKHTHLEKHGQPPLPEVGKFMDNEKYSVMSYNGATEANRYGHAVNMMALDVAALQALYGAQDYAMLDSSYTLENAKVGALSLAEDAVAIGQAYFCIWDTGGIDTIDYAGSGNSVLINLNDATLNTDRAAVDVRSMIGELKLTGFYSHLSASLQKGIVDPWHHAGGFFSQVLVKSADRLKAIDGGFSIAHGATIENAVGGNKGDLLIGNEADNQLIGRSGADTLLGSKGSDALFGDGGKDRLDGGKGDDVLQGGAGRDRFVFSDGYGKDTIADFTDGDRIDLARLADFGSYKNLFRNHMANSGDDVVITVGPDQLTISNHHKADLSHSDFLI